jgi:sarcosine oxidase subunit alpha
VLTAGAHLFRQGDPAISANDQGYVTSVCHSPTLGTSIGLAMLKDGRARKGEVVRFVDHLRHTDFPCEVVEPVFFDPEGGRLRG